MTNKKPNRGSRVQTGDISNISGPVNIAGGDLHIRTSSSIRQDISNEIIARALAEAIAQTRKRSKTTTARKTKIKDEVNSIASELEKKEADKGFLAERFMNLAKMAPDILDVILTGIGNPGAGIGLVVKKIAQKAKVQAEKDATKP